MPRSSNRNSRGRSQQQTREGAEPQNAVNPDGRLSLCGMITSFRNFIKACCTTNVSLTVPVFLAVLIAQSVIVGVVVAWLLDTGTGHACDHSNHSSTSTPPVLIPHLLNITATSLATEGNHNLPSTESTMETTITTPPTIMKSPRDLYKEEMTRLDALACVPRPKIHSVLQLLDKDDEVLDQLAYHPYIAINQCNSESSFCPSGKRCLPTATSQRDREMWLKVRSGIKIRYVQRVAQNIKEDTECSCQ